MRFTAFHSAARISLQPKVCRGKFPISNAIKSSSGPVNLQRVCENHPSLERKACKRLTTSLLAQHYETLLRDGLRCRCLIITSNSNSVFSSRASCQNQAHQLGPPQYRGCNGLPVTFALLGLFCAVCFVLFCFSVFVLVPPVYFCHSMSRASLRQLVNSLISATCNERVERPGESQEASTEKNSGTRDYLASNCRLPEVGT